MAARVTYEVYWFDGSRWNLQQTFKSHQREAAIAQAQETYAEPHVKGVQVMQETYEEGTNEHAEKSVFKRTKSDEIPKSLDGGSAAGGKSPPSKADAVRGPRSVAVASRTVPDAPVPKPRTAPKSSAAKPEASQVREPPGAIRLISIIAGSGAVAAAGGIIFALQAPADTPLLVGLRGALGPYYLLAIAGTSFAVGLCIAGLLLIAEGSARTLLYEVERAPAAAVRPGSVVAPRVDIPKPSFKKVEVVEEEPPTPAAAAVATPEATQLVAFFQQSLAALPRNAPYMKDGRLDANGLFGCYMFLAGLCDGDARDALFSGQAARDILSVAMGAVLGDAKAASRFAARYEEFLTEPKALAMFEAGIAAATARKGSDLNAPGRLHDALEDWAGKSGPALNTGHVAVMFTDIIDSTAFTQIHGDAKQYEMVQAHNGIVRLALQTFSGREIKHTGDGIMAAFDDAMLAVQASQLIHNEIRAHRDVMPDIGMKLRIGIAAGEPIKEGTDLFGSTVQLAARVTNLAEAEQTVVADGVQQICANTGIPFIDLGEKPLKGFKQPVRVYAVG